MDYHSNWFKNGKYKENQKNLLIFYNEHKLTYLFEIESHSVILDGLEFTTWLG